MVTEQETDNMNLPLYNIKAVVNQTGLNPATIRAWERRYGFPQPQRSSGGHRQYSKHDIDTLNWLIAQQHDGMSISHAIELWQSLAESGEDPVQDGAPSAAAELTTIAAISGEQIDELRETWISACLNYDRQTAEAVLVRAFAIFPPEVVCSGILQAALVEIGEAWHQGTATVQQEHFATALCTQRVELLLAAAQPPTRPERIVVCAVPGERHTFSALLLSYYLRRRGWEVVYLGADVPLDRLSHMITETDPQLVIASAQLLTTAANLIDFASSLQSEKTLLAYGGMIFDRNKALQARIAGHYLGDTLDSAVERVNLLLTNPPPNPEITTPTDAYRRAFTQYAERQALIDSQIWGSFVSRGQSTRYLRAINNDVSQAILAALKLGDLALLGSDNSWWANWLLSYRLSAGWITDYVGDYHRAATLHLGDAHLVTEWLAAFTGESST